MISIGGYGVNLYTGSFNSQWNQHGKGKTESKYGMYVGEYDNGQWFGFATNKSSNGSVF